MSKILWIRTINCRIQIKTKFASTYVLSEPEVYEKKNEYTYLELYIKCQRIY